MPTNAEVNRQGPCSYENGSPLPSMSTSPPHIIALPFCIELQCDCNQVLMWALSEMFPGIYLLQKVFLQSRKAHFPRDFLGWVSWLLSCLYTKFILPCRAGWWASCFKVGTVYTWGWCEHVSCWTFGQLLHPLGADKDLWRSSWQTNGGIFVVIVFS